LDIAAGVVMVLFNTQLANGFVQYSVLDSGSSWYRW